MKNNPELFNNDQKLFTDAAQYYTKYRPKYESEFFDYIIDSFKLDGKGRLLDLGCGTGQLAIPFAKNFEEVIGLDPEKGMLEEAKKEAKKAGVKNIKWVLSKAEEITKKMGTFRLVTMGASFHWMKQEEVLEKIYNLTEKNGGVVIMYDTSYSMGWEKKDIGQWKKIRLDILKKYLGEKRRAGNSFYKKPEKTFEDLLDDSSFGNHEKWTHEYVRTWTIDTIIGFIYSTSFAAPRLFGNRIREFEEELKTELLKIEPSGIFKEKVRIEALLARKHN